jgi:signal peptidase I
MNPTLGEADLLKIEPYSDRRPEVGDVVLFVPPGDARQVVHRTVRVMQQGIRTRGDNSCLDDDWLLQPDQLVGRITGAWRGDRHRKIAGGRAGWLYARSLRWRRALDAGISRLLHPLYRAAAYRGRLARLLPLRLRPRLVAYETRGRRQVHLLMGKNIIGRYDAARDQWQIRRPFRLFVDKNALQRAAEQARERQIPP